MAYVATSRPQLAASILSSDLLLFGLSEGHRSRYQNLNHLQRQSLRLQVLVLDRPLGVPSCSSSWLSRSRCASHTTSPSSAGHELSQRASPRRFLKCYRAYLPLILAMTRRLCEWVDTRLFLDFSKRVHFWDDRRRSRGDWQQQGISNGIHVTPVTH